MQLHPEEFLSEAPIKSCREGSTHSTTGHEIKNCRHLSGSRMEFQDDSIHLLCSAARTAPPLAGRPEPNHEALRRRSCAGRTIDRSISLIQSIKPDRIERGSLPSCAWLAGMRRERERERSAAAASVSVTLVRGCSHSGACAAGSTRRRRRRRRRRRLAR